MPLPKCVTPEEAEKAVKNATDPLRGQETQRINEALINGQRSFASLGPNAVVAKLVEEDFERAGWIIKFTSVDRNETEYTFSSNPDRRRHPKSR